MIAGWVKNIIFIVLFASFLELLLPTSSLQRFIRVIMGLLIMLAILNPAIDAVQGNWIAADMPALGTGRHKQADIIKTASQMAEDRERLVKEIYKRDMAKQIRALVMAIEGVAEVRVAIDLQDKSGNDAGEIRKITLYVKPGNMVKPGAIEKISVGASPHPELELQERAKNKIKTTIIELYQLRGEQIEILQWK